jgi:hypothetical protein
MARRDKAHEEVLEMVQENRTEGLLVRAEPLERAEEISHSMVEVERLKDGALWLDVDPSWAGAINAVLVANGVKVNEMTSAVRLPERAAV